MVAPGDVVLVDFPGAEITKRRPAVVVSSESYHSNRPDVILGLLTTRIPPSPCPSDHILKDWKIAGLHHPSCFRSFLITVPAKAIRGIGHLSEADWIEVQNGLRNAFGGGTRVI